MMQYYDPETWLRPGGTGHRLQFFATDEEVNEWLSKYLPEKWAPYIIVGSDLVRNEGERRYHEQPFRFEVSEFLQNLQGPRERRWNFNIGSLALSPNIDQLLQGQIDANCAINGLLNLQQGRRVRRGGDVVGDESALGMLDRIANIVTNEEARHPEYFNLFKAMKKAITAHLRYSAVELSPDGQEVPNPDVRMTEGIVRLYEAGQRFTCRPGPPIK